MLGICFLFCGSRGGGGGGVYVLETFTLNCTNSLVLI